MHMNRFASWRTLAILAVCAFVVGAMLASPRPGTAEGAAKSKAAPAAKPAPSAKLAPSSAPAYPSALLAAGCVKQADELGRAHKDFGVVIEPPFVVAGDMPAVVLRRHAEASVVRPAKVMWASYFAQKPDKPITILLFDGKEGYGKYAKADYPGGDFPFFGYYSNATRTMVMNIQTGGGTLVHELTHALIVYDFAAVPSWFNEGMASLHEQCSIGDKEIVGLVNWRLPGLQSAMKDGKLRPLRDLVSKGDFYGAQSGTNYAQARYFCLYMQRLGLLGKFYRHFRDHSAGADALAVEHVFERKLEDVEKDYLAWVKTLKFE